MLRLLVFLDDHPLVGSDFVKTNSKRKKKKEERRKKKEERRKKKEERRKKKRERRKGYMGSGSLVVL